MKDVEEMKETLNEEIRDMDQKIDDVNNNYEKHGDHYY